MPQFDFYSFSGQIFWTLSVLLLDFISFIFLVYIIYLTKFAAMFKIRQKLIMTYIKENKVLLVQ